MIYYINENSRNNDNIFDCIIESSSIISDIRLLPYETDLFVNESVKDKVVGFFKKIIQKVREFFGKMRKFFQRKNTEMKIESLKNEANLNKERDSSTESKTKKPDKLSLKDPSTLNYKQSINAIQKKLHEWINYFADNEAKALTGQEYESKYDYTKIKNSFDDLIDVEKTRDHMFRDIDIDATLEKVVQYCTMVQTHINEMESSMNGLEKDIISELNNYQKSLVQGSTTIRLNYISALMTSTLSAIQKCSTNYYTVYSKMIDVAREKYKNSDSDM